MKFQALVFNKIQKHFPSVKEEDYINDHSRSNSSFQQEFFDLEFFVDLFIPSFSKDILFLLNYRNDEKIAFKIFYLLNDELKPLKLYSNDKNYLFDTIEMLANLSSDVYLCKVFPNKSKIIYKVIL